MRERPCSYTEPRMVVENHKDKTFENASLHSSK